VDPHRGRRGVPAFAYFDLAGLSVLDAPTRKELRNASARGAADEVHGTLLTWPERPFKDREAI
jgi:hypothetical protein